MSKNLMIAIDGPAASGKGTLCRKLAEHFNLPHLDTGLTYRAVGYHMLEQDLPLNDEAVAIRAAMDVDMGALDRTKLAQHHVGEAASKIAVMPGVRKALVEAQRQFAQSGKGAILDGRDIGTVVLPKADVKLYVTASAETRAKRRHEEIVERFKTKEGEAPAYEQILADINERDERDMGRKDSPLRPAEDAILIDTSKMDIEQAFSSALQAIKAKTGS